MSDRVHVIHMDGNQHSDKNRTAALLLCLFLRVLRDHRFYVGKVGTDPLAADGRRVRYRRPH